MIERTRGNLLHAKTEALVNTVNCVGAMGKGIAFQFKQAYPENYKAYAKACKAKEVRPGEMFIFETAQQENPKYIINFPTKRHWRGKSRIEDIESGLFALVRAIKNRGIQSVAIPPLGCGLGGLSWSVVHPMIEEAFAELPEVFVLLFEPRELPKTSERPIRTKRPRMTKTRAAVVKLMAQYKEQGYELTLLELQKLAYFLQEAGEPMKLSFSTHIYGPYAGNLTKSLTHMEGHLVQGFNGSRAPELKLSLIPGALEEAESVLEKELAVRARLERVTALIEGFETPYGMEMLASLHWIAKHDPEASIHKEVAIQKVKEWNQRKEQLFNTKHLQIAWQHLKDTDWLHLPEQKGKPLESTQ